jgi:methionine sulfoxide reductase heme-binding subunit
MASQSRYAYLAPAIITGWLLTLAQLGYRVATHQLGANPIANVINQLGLLALVLLVASLSATPLKLSLGWTWPLRVRRTLGLLAFFTVVLHFFVYLGPDQGFDLSAVLGDLGKRSFILDGFLAFALMIPLAWTSSKQAVQRLTFRVWQRLHRLVYAVAFLACLHFYLRVKIDHTQPLVYAGIVALGFLIRLAAWREKARSRRARSLPG